MSKFQLKFDEVVWKIVSRIRPGRVLSYGQVARAAGFPRHARMVSKAMSRSVEPLPWHRVIKSDYSLAFVVGSKQYNKQRDLLKKEGVNIVGAKVIPNVSDDNSDLDEMLWGPPD